MSEFKALLLPLLCLLIPGPGAQVRMESVVTGSYSQLLTEPHFPEHQNIQRWINFQSSVKRQHLLNSHSKLSKQSAKYGVNQFSILSPQEFKDLYLTAQPKKVPEFNYSKPALPKSAHYPLHFDWREHGAVGPVHNQQSCGACWAFSVVSAMESMIVKGGGKLPELSVQQVIDCAYKSRGCDGGSTVSTLEWLKQTGEKLVNETDYPYEAKTGVCQLFPRLQGGVSVTDFTALDFSEHEEVMKQYLVDWGPLIAVVDAVSWQDYLGGVIQHHCSSEHANHAVLIVGYDLTGEVPFWIVRNSWGTSWGDEGYVYIKMGVNMCGVADSVAAVAVMSSHPTPL